jgi:hypothetical protein
MEFSRFLVLVVLTLSYIQQVACIFTQKRVALFQSLIGIILNCNVAVKRFPQYLPEVSIPDRDYFELQYTFLESLAAYTLVSIPDRDYFELQWLSVEALLYLVSKVQLTIFF